MSSAALIVAAGSGQRFRTSTQHTAKQYHVLGDKAVLAHSLQTFLRHPRIDHVQVVIAKGDDTPYHELVASLALSPQDKAKLCASTYGGTSRQQSVWHGLQALHSTSPPPRFVLIHDAARPFVSESLIDSLVAALEAQAQAVLPVVDINDTIKHVADGVVTKTLERGHIKRAQTPQGFDFSAIFAAHKRMAEQAPHDASDDASIAELNNIPVMTIPGDTTNIKITHPEDLTSSPAHAQPRDVRVGNGFDVHRLVDDVDRGGLILGGITIPFDKKLKGHSDADVVLHALTDALLGALGQEDIGHHFPPSDPQWQQADSAQFLEDAAKRVHQAGYAIAHCDMTIICEAPKIGAHRDAMRQRIGEILAIGTARISIKATTTEGLGFCGRGEGIATQATVTLVPSSPPQPPRP
ncbi:MAG: bifunctional 2-C-methyl-D-erythritol 4-phosphate cytidylyltransferase/2-C-methyl-D-erythritol 2,4-cyclodiphosphate synthase [Alphaproteobacteria bacterium GM202ARS2]|nr:bifunctional 2-C-methyl-D-erythritol 4-phosphate cytidylyltransferase/2-C-methyl-D-erythritol 2,4-cyclodiphosphate synthase [Alphaproteobacteria bacterium GM202ARS2]